MFIFILKLCGNKKCDEEEEEEEGHILAFLPPL